MRDYPTLHLDTNLCLRVMLDSLVFIYINILSYKLFLYFNLSKGTACKKGYGCN